MANKRLWPTNDYGQQTTLASESVVSMSSQNRSSGTGNTPEALPPRQSGRTIDVLTIQYPDEVPLFQSVPATCPSTSSIRRRANCAAWPARCVLEDTRRSAVELGRERTRTPGGRLGSPVSSTSTAGSTCRAGCAPRSVPSTPS